MIIEILKIVFLLGMAQGLTLVILLLVKKQENKHSNLILAIFIVTMVVTIWNDYVFLLPIEFIGLNLAKLSVLMTWVYGPLLYFYTCQMSAEKQLGLKQIALHLTPSLLATLTLLVKPLITAKLFGLSVMFFFYLLLYCHLACYMVFALLRIRQHNRLAEQNLSAIENVSLEWLTLLVYGFAAIWAVDSMQTLSALLKFRLFNHYSQIVSVLLSIYIFGIGLIALARPQIHFHRLVVKPTAKYHRSTLTGSAADQLAEKIKSTVQTQQLYLDNDLSLGALSEHLQMKPHHVSQVLNEKLNMTFYDFINFSRVSRAQEMLSSGQFTQLAIIDIAYQVGFNNKATFNAAFKKYTKQTPSQFKKAALV